MCLVTLVSEVTVAVVRFSVEADSFLPTISSRPI